MPEDDEKRAAHRALMDRVLHGPGQAGEEQRARAFGNEGLASPLDVLIGKVATSPAEPRGLRGRRQVPAQTRLPLMRRAS